MKYSQQSTGLAPLLTLAILLGGVRLWRAGLQAAEPQGTSVALVAQRSFATPDEAIKTLQAALRAENKTALRAIFSPAIDELLTGDDVQDANNARCFATAMEQGCQPIDLEPDKVTFELGTNRWPMAIPLVKADGRWYFDTAAGKEELINRHIGKDELHAIGVCRTYVVAQRQYANTNPERVVGIKYAQKFKSTSGKRDGLYWPAAENEPGSPFGPLVAEAQSEGYGSHNDASPHPFHGYIFRILSRQGKAAPGGKMNYMSGNTLAGGFALVAYPAYWDRSGIMTFIVNQDGEVYQRNLGENTVRIAGAMKEYNPDRHWALVPEPGAISAVAER